MGVRERDAKLVIGERVNLTASFSRSPEVISDLTMPPGPDCRARCCLGRGGWVGTCGSDNKRHYVGA